MEATKRPWAITNEGSAYMQGTIIVRENIEIAGVWKKEDAELVVRAVNTFDQAREALKLARRRLNEGMRGKIDAVMEHGGDPGIVNLLDEALAAMEATLCQPDK